MRAFALHDDELRLCLADVGDLAPAVERLAFERAGMVFVRRFPGDATFAAQAAERFELCAEAMVRQLADVDPVPWEDALELLVQRAGTDGWTLVGGWIGARWWRAFGPARIEGVGDYAGAIVDLDTAAWRGHELHVGTVA
jgi:hypothetical protein